MIEQYLSPAPHTTTRVELGPHNRSLPGPLGLMIDLEAASVGGPLGWAARIASAEIETGYNYTGLEERISSILDFGLPILDYESEEQGESIQNPKSGRPMGHQNPGWGGAVTQVEELCGRCSQANALAMVQAVEAMAGAMVPPRAAYLRLVLVEMERIVSHLLNAAEMMSVLGLLDKESALRDIRERVFQAVGEWTGSRLQPGLMGFGGLSRHVDETTSKELALAARPLERALRGYVSDIINNREVAARLAGLGVIPAQEAQSAGLRGPVARASGLAQDIRASFPTGAYEEEGVTIVAQRGGDAFARLAVRLLESLESFRIVEQALDDLPGGPVKGRVILDVRSGSGFSRVEGPRGEVFCWISGTPEGLSGLHLSTGSFPSLNFLPLFLRGRHLDDLPLLLLSMDICMGCVER